MVHPENYSLSKTRDTLHFPPSSREFLEHYLPPTRNIPLSSNPTKPHITLTFAASLDSQLSLSPGLPTALSGPASKAMTHYLRSRHDAILVGVGTAIADDPSLNCRIEGVGGYGGEGLEGQPRPVILDPNGRWAFSEEIKVFVLAREGRGRAPYVVTGTAELDEGRRRVLEGCGGKLITVGMGERGLEWGEVLRVLGREGIRSVMVEGGGKVINSLLKVGNQGLVDSVIVTIAPTWLGEGGVVVSPPRRFGEDGNAMSAVKLGEVKWQPFGEDVVMCGRIKL
ncbi:putative riboflavin biosynthesis protein Rib7 [Patellaria atrata CBS 101060]|uniref:2,5-diamino-6-ribosylamino-4(3H)-pyrimidinone 5'-phosphate reductase n=1 Tax=Patellaria atrata CBS 101060 TaxID=1346257 RepID=A0A9P4VLE9_9PEZI|nr:putative riboflavin biosynthesis protein Rib7 [Patellaria atrata CBS 101060]